MTHSAEHLPGHVNFPAAGLYPPRALWWQSQAWVTSPSHSGPSVLPGKPEVSQVLWVLKCIQFL